MDQLLISSAPAKVVCSLSLLCCSFTLAFVPFDRQAHSATSFKPTLQFGPLFKAVPIFVVAHTKARDFHFQLTIRLNLAKGKVYL